MNIKHDASKSSNSRTILIERTAGWRGLEFDCSLDLRPETIFESVLRQRHEKPPEKSRGLFVNI